MKRVIAYVDGFNLYFGLKHGNLQNCYWLNIRGLINSFIKDDRQLIQIYYFTSEILTNDLGKKKRQQKYLSALRTLQDVKIVYGKYISVQSRCPVFESEFGYCDGIFDNPQEKMTDVNIALSMVTDAIYDKYDEAILVSGDMDLQPAVKLIRERCPDKKITIFFPPNRKNNELSEHASAYLVLFDSRLKKYQFPDEIRDVYGRPLKRPESWK